MELISHFIPKFSIKSDSLKKNKSILINNLNRLYPPICFDFLNIHPYPLLLDKHFFFQLEDCHSLIIEVIPKIVNNFFNDGDLQQIISLDDKTLNLLYLLKDKKYEIGFIRPDFIFDKNNQIKICEINARFPLNAFVLSQCLSDEIYKQFSAELSFININKTKNLEIFRQCFDCQYPVHILLNKERSFEIDLLKKMLLSLEFKLRFSYEFLSKNNNNLQMILNLHQEELINLELSLLKQMIKQTYFNDLRTIFIVHDKRFLSILSNPFIMSKYLSSKKYNRLKNYIIPTYNLNNDVIKNIKSNAKNWVLKKNAAGKGEGMLIGKEAQPDEIQSVLTKKRFDYIAQPFIAQRLFQFLNNASPITNHTINKNPQFAYLVGTMLSVNNIFLGPGLLRGSCKSIINVAQGDTTIFTPFSLN